MKFVNLVDDEQKRERETERETGMDKAIKKFLLTKIISHSSCIF